MYYYRVELNESVLGYITSWNFRKYVPQINKMLCCREQEAQYIQLKNIYYRTSWLLPMVYDPYDAVEVNVIMINKKEYEEGIKTFE